MKISNQTTFTWVNGWSLTITPAWNCVKVSVMGPRQVFYTISEDRTYVQPSADEAFNYLSTKCLAEVMLLIGRMPSRVMVEPFVVEQPVSKPVIVDDMCSRCGGRMVMQNNERSCEDCHEESLEQVCYDPNQFNSLQS